MEKTIVSQRRGGMDKNSIHCIHNGLEQLKMNQKYSRWVKDNESRVKEEEHNIEYMQNRIIIKTIENDMHRMNDENANLQEAIHKSSIELQSLKCKIEGTNREISRLLDDLNTYQRNQQILLATPTKIENSLEGKSKRRRVNTLYTMLKAELEFLTSTAETESSIEGESRIRVNRLYEMLKGEQKFLASSYD